MPDEVSPGCNVEVTETVKNTGSSSTGEFYVGYTIQEEKQVTTSTANQYFPSIYGDRIVYEDVRNGNWDIYMYTISSGQETRITTSTANQYSPSIYGDRISYTDDRNGNSDIYMYTISSGQETRITTSTANQYGSSIYGDWIVYEDVRNGILNIDIYMSSVPFLLGDYRVVSDLAPGASSTATTSVKLPSYLECGVNYTFGVIADVTGQVNENSELNNIGVDITPSKVSNVDLSVFNIYAPATAVLSKYILVSNTVLNSGTDSSRGFYVKFYLSRDTTINSSDKYLGQRYVAELAGGASNSSYTKIYIPESAGVGYYYLGAIVDATGVVTESNELNNSKSSSTKMMMFYPDLSPTMISGPSKAKRGDYINLKYMIKNLGNYGASGFTVKFYLSRDKNITSTDKYLGSRSIAGLAAGASITTTNQLYIPLSLAKGYYYIGIIVDTTNSIKESNEANNKIYYTRLILIT